MMESFESELKSWPVEGGCLTASEITTRYGVLETFRPAEDLISRFLSTYGEWSQHELEFVASNVPDGARVCDVGAFLGTFGIGVSQLTSVSNLCFVDANPAVIPMLRRNVERNLKVSSVIVEAIVGRKGFHFSGSVIPGNRGSFSVLQGADVGRESAPSALRTITLRELNDQHGPFDLFKIDAEGMEYEILSADSDFLRATQSTFWLECNPTTASLKSAELLLSLGFNVFYFAFPAISKNNFNSEGDREYPFAYEAGLWITKNKPAPNTTSESMKLGCSVVEICGQEDLRRALWLTPRWSPTEWDGHSLPEVVALASHALLGEEYSTYLTEADGGAQPSWADALPIRLQAQFESELEAATSKLAKEREDSNAELVAATSKLRAYEIMFAKEREELRAAFEQRENINRTLQSSNAELKAAASKLRAFEIMLAKERDRCAVAVKTVESELLQLRELVSIAQSESYEARNVAQAQTNVAQAQAQVLQAVYRSRSWRLMMPVRMAGRFVRGDWRELRRLFRAKFGSRS